MNKNKKSKVVLFSILGLAAISIGTVGFATWMVGVEKKSETINDKANVDNTLNESIYLEAVTDSQPLIVAEKETHDKLTDEILGAKEGTGTGEGYVSVSEKALKFTFSTLQFSVGNGATKPTKLHISLSTEAGDNSFNIIAIDGNKLDSIRTGTSWNYLQLDKVFDIDVTGEHTTITTTKTSGSSYDLYEFTTKTFEFDWGTFFGGKSPVKYYNGISTTAEDKSAAAVFSLADNVNSELVAMDTALKGQTFKVNVALEE